jgi:uncharacterized protein (TIGR03067 family)
MRPSIIVRAYALLTLLVLTLALSSQPRSLAQEALERKELAGLQGTWVIVGKEFMGNKASEEEVKKLTGKTVIKGNKIAEWAGERGKEKIISESTFKLDRATKPKTMDLKYTRGVLKGDTQLAIYELDGDTLKVCYSFGKGEKRPSTFTGKVDGKALFLTYKRLVQPDPD